MQRWFPIRLKDSSESLVSFDREALGAVCSGAATGLEFAEFLSRFSAYRSSASSEIAWDYRNWNSNTRKCSRRGKGEKRA